MFFHGFSCDLNDVAGRQPVESSVLFFGPKLDAFALQYAGAFRCADQAIGVLRRNVEMLVAVVLKIPTLWLLVELLVADLLQGQANFGEHLKPTADDIFQFFQAFEVFDASRFMGHLVPSFRHFLSQAWSSSMS